MPYNLEKWFSSRWIAGPTMEDALERSKVLNKNKISVLVNYLGEDITKKVDVTDAVDTYMRLITEMSASRIRGDISVKPTQIGLCISEKLMRENYMAIMEHAKMHGIFVWLDMEEPNHIDKIITVYLDTLKRVKGGICIQAYLKRSHADVERIVRAGGIIRLVKGAYFKKGMAGAFDNREAVTKSYLKSMSYLFDNSKRFMIATHDQKIISYAMLMGKDHPASVTYAMLNGIDNQYAKKIAQSHSMALYVPFGTKWIGYSYRRLKEAGHARLLLHSLFKSQQLQ